MGILAYGYLMGIIYMKTMVGYIILMGISWVYYLMGIICWVGLNKGYTKPTVRCDPISGDKSQFAMQQMVHRNGRYTLIFTW